MSIRQSVWTTCGSVQRWAVTPARVAAAGVRAVSGSSHQYAVPSNSLARLPRIRLSNSGLKTSGPST
uniref:Uncharacterized protein n=1 Tax=uncultured marine virus TaxID=186617 RepID=A0A0F7L9U0_9VIRU|nr:hypothetical protein [uncultured marine virus]